MPTENLGVEIKMSGDMDPKTYSPMSGSDENMSSPPSVLTTASAGSCTPSSLPSAGSTPSSIPSAGSTPYQFVSQEESTVIKPLTPLDHQSVNPCTPDQPVTPDPSVTSELSVHELIPDLGTCKKRLISVIENTHCRITANNGNGSISEDINEKRENCPCIMCDDKQTCQIPSSENAMLDSRTSSDLKSKSKGKSKNKDKKSGRPHRKRQQKSRKIHYQSELTEGPESTSIKLKIKLTTTSLKHKSSLATHKTTSQSVNESFCLNSLSVCSSTPLKSSVSSSAKGKHNGKRKSSDGINTLPRVTQESPQTESVKKRRKTVDHFHKWGPISVDVNGETQSPWGYSIPRHILKKILLWATYSQGCIPFLSRMSKVCRLWREVSILPELWHTADLASGLIKPRFKNDKKLLWLLENRLPKVEDLNLAGWSEAICPFMLRRISEICPKLKSLNLAHCYKLHAENLHSLLYSSKNLRRLDLTSIMGTHKPTPRCAVGQQTLSDIAATLNSQLTHLVIANNTLANVPSIITSLAEHCNNLEVLDLSIVETIGRDPVRLDIEMLQAGCPLLRILRLANSLITLCQNPLSVQASSPGFPKLEELSVAADGRNHFGMSDAELERILKNSNKLRLLDVRGCHRITDSSLVRIPPWDLEHLFLSGGAVPRSYSDRLELVIRKWQHSLVELDLSWTGSGDAVDAALLSLAEENNEKLRILDLSGSSMSFKSVRKVLTHCHNLRWLNLTACRSLPRGIKRLYGSASDVAKLRSSVNVGKFDDPSPDV